MQAGRQAQSWGRDLFLALCAIALAMLVIVPPGFMVGGAPGRGRVVICTGHGPVDSAADLGGMGAPGPGKKSMAPCPFTGHAPPLDLTAPGPALAVAWTRFAIFRGTRSDQILIGRTQAAPPPARGPPPTLI